MSDSFSSVLEVYNLFSEGSIVVILFVVALIISIFVKNNKIYRIAIVIPNVLFLVVLINPVFMNTLLKMGDVFKVARLFWILQITLVFAYVITAISEKSKKIVYKIIVAAISIVCIVFFGKYMFSEENFRMSENIYKVPNDVIEVCEIVEKDGNRGKVIPNAENAEYFRQYDANISLAFPRTTFVITDLTAQMMEETYDVEKILEVSAYQNVKYLVLGKNHAIKDDPLDFGLTFLGETSGSNVYRIN